MRTKHNLPDVGGHADEVAAVEKRLGLTLPPSVREFVAFAHDLSAHQQGKMGIFRDGYLVEEVPDQPAVSLIELSEGTARWAIQRDDISEPNPPVHVYVDSQGEADERFVQGLWPPSPSLTEFMFNYALSNARFGGGLIEVHTPDVENVIATLTAQCGAPISLRSSFPFSNAPDRMLFEVVNFAAVLSDERVCIQAARSVSEAQVPKAIWDIVGDTKGSGVFAKRSSKK